MEDNMAITHRKVEIAVRVDESNEIKAIGTLGWHPDIDVLAMRSYCDRGGVVLLLVTSNPLKACRILEAAGLQCKSDSVVLVGPLGQSGRAASVGMILAEAGVNVLRAYASHLESGQHYLVFKTSEDERAMQVIESNMAIRNMARVESVEASDELSPSISGLHQHAA
jgi:hypothetical protein